MNIMCTYYEQGTKLTTADLMMSKTLFFSHERYTLGQWFSPLDMNHNGWWRELFLDPTPDLAGSFWEGQCCIIRLVQK